MVLNYKQEKGITLVALVITVIILLILAGVALTLITGQNGLFARANYAGYEFDQSSQEEAGFMAGMNTYLDQYDIYSGNGGSQGGNQQNINLQDSITETPTTFSVQANATNVTLSVLPAYVGTDGTTFQYSISTDGTTNWVNPRISTDTSHTFTGLTPKTQYTVNVKIGETAQTAQSVTTASQASMKDVSTVADAIKYSASAISATDTTYEGTYKELTASDGNVKVPVGFTVRYDSASTIDGGIVVADQNDNQWVWIPVNANNTYERRDFHTYGIFEENYIAETLTEAEEKVTTVGGFYIARCEAGSAEDTANVTMRSAETVAKTVTIKRDQVPYNYVAINSNEASASTNGNMIDLCTGIATANEYKTGITTKLCSSYAWDTTLNFVDNDAWSCGDWDWISDIGQNYFYSVGFKYKKISNGVIVEADKPTSGDWEDEELVLTGQGDATKNIYDMGGNCMEYTTELSYFPDYHASNYIHGYVSRGGHPQYENPERPAGDRSDDDGLGELYTTFRATLYL